VQTAENSARSEVPWGLEAATPPPLSAAEFAEIRRIAYRSFGLDLKEGKQSLVVARLGKVVRRYGFSSFAEYCKHVGADASGESLAELANALTTNFTSFMREPAHFDLLRSELAPRLAAKGGGTVWSAASSSGEEAYSILFTLIDALGPGPKLRVLGTDISTKVLDAARNAVYQRERVESLPGNWLQRFFQKGNGRWLGWYRVKPEFREMVEFKCLNLNTDAMPSTRFPVVFCRNVMIYFDKPTQGALVQRLASVLEPGGWLLIGHSESLAGVDHGLRYVKPAVYRTTGNGD
jgi:chemotaxis protein methyltransferase CheR